MIEMLKYAELKSISVLFDFLQTAPGFNKEEFGEEIIELMILDSWMDKYAYLHGEFRIWENGGQQIGITFHTSNAPSNHKPWLGMIIIHTNYRGKGYGRKIVELLSKELYGSRSSVLCAGVPYKQINWGIFLGKCGFEQIAFQKDANDKSYIVFGKALE